MSDLISRQKAIYAARRLKVNEEYCTDYDVGFNDGIDEMVKMLYAFSSTQPEPLTDKEQRIFLAAMGREEKVCEELDRNYVREPYEDSLMRVCKEIRRKVKGALWT